MVNQSVGRGGRNQPADVRRVQQLLNDNRCSPQLIVDAACGPRTVEAVLWFQSRVLRMSRPDGLVEPHGATWRGLARRAGAAPGAAAPRADATAPDERRAFRHDRAKFVDPRVKELPVTTRIIDALMPHLAPTGARVISAWLSDSDLRWKVNYHWEYLLWMIDGCLVPGEPSSAALTRMRSALLGVSPTPSSGYRTGPVGKPEDTSSGEEASRRHVVLTAQKRAFAQLVREHRLSERSKRPRTAFDLAAAPVAAPGKTKHSTGFAVDVQGPNGDIRAICRRLGASLVFDEQSHVHVEFKHGVVAS